MSKAKKAQKKQKNQQKDAQSKKNAWEAGKLIEENHGRESYSADFTEKIANRLNDLLIEYTSKSSSSTEWFTYFWQLKRKIINTVVYWSPEVPENDIWKKLKYTLDQYWRNDPNIFINMKNTWKV